jgi:hypothetical protein
MPASRMVSEVDLCNVKAIFGVRVGVHHDALESSRFDALIVNCHRILAVDAYIELRESAN